MKAIYRHKTSGDLFAIETDASGRVVSTAGPLLTKDLDPKHLDYDNYFTGEVSAISETGAIPQNVNYAVKSAFVMPFVENIPEIKQAGKAAYKDRAEIIEQMKKATVLVICY